MRLTIKNDQPPRAFVERLIEQAIQMLKTQQQNKKPNERTTVMKLAIKKTAAIAASIVIAASIIAVVLSGSTKQNQGLVTSPRAGNQKVTIAQTGNLTPLELELPGFIIEGTAINLQGVENLESFTAGQRPPFMVPKGTTNVAAGKSVTCSDPDDVVLEDLTKVTDGDKSGMDDSWVELGIFEQSITIDLGEKHEIYAIVVWHYHKDNRVYFDVVAQVSDDSDFIENVVTVFNNDHDASSGFGEGTDKNFMETNEGKIIDAKGTQARFVRLHSAGNVLNELNHYVEVEVYGKPIKQ